MSELTIQQLEEKLTGKQRLFALSYVGEAKFNATKAARIARYRGTDNDRAVIGHDNLRKTNIANYIKLLTEQRLKDAGYQVDRVTREIIDIAFCDSMDFFEVDKNNYLRMKCDLKDLPTNAIESIQVRTQQTKYIGSGKGRKEIETWVTTIKFHSKEWALGMLSKLLDMKSGDTPLTGETILRVIYENRKPNADVA